MLTGLAFEITGYITFLAVLLYNLNGLACMLYTEGGWKNVADRSRVNFNEPWKEIFAKKQGQKKFEDPNDSRLVLHRRIAMVTKWISWIGVAALFGPSIVLLLISGIFHLISGQ